MLKNVIQLGVLLLLALFIWFIAPLITIAGYPLLPSPLLRLSVILLIVLSWGLYHFIRPITNPPQPALPTESLPEELDEPLLLLSKHFATVRQLLRQKTKGWRRLCGEKHPLHLILGMKQAGKSALLQRSGLPLTTI